jgi:hypothetical protein
MMFKKTPVRNEDEGRRLFRAVIQKLWPGFESPPENSARFWTAAALCRSGVHPPVWESGRGLPQSKTLARIPATPGFAAATVFLKRL